MRGVTLLATVAVLTVVGTASAGSWDGPTRHAIPTAGISLATPSSWRAVDSRTVLASAAAQDLLRRNPQFASIINQIAGTNSPVKFLSFDPHVSDRFATNVNVVVSAVPANVTLAVLAAAISAQFKTLSGLRGPVSTSIVRLPMGPAAKTTVQLTVRTGGKKLTVQTLQYAFLRHGRSIVVTFSTTPNQRARRAATFRAIVTSIRFP